VVVRYGQDHGGVVPRCSSYFQGQLKVTLPYWVLCRWILG
jgi:hypothetical protein